MKIKYIEERFTKVFEKYRKDDINKTDLKIIWEISEIVYQVYEKMPDEFAEIWYKEKGLEV
ncbi:MAG: hypothetical protein B6I31_00005 [Desulfobacteraceae bacterium 4572_19]|nr:MAG: hypothetical protein B6I31_00005 [Desulfobacteraceae bacterium 4572_19]